MRNNTLALFLIAVVGYGGAHLLGASQLITQFREENPFVKLTLDTVDSLGRPDEVRQLPVPSSSPTNLPIDNSAQPELGGTLISDTGRSLSIDHSRESTH